MASVFDSPVSRATSVARRSTSKFLIFSGMITPWYINATKSGENGKESSPNRFQIGVSKTYGDDYNLGWGRLDRDQQRAFPNSAAARWKAGIRFGLHYAFLGEATIGSKALSVTILDTRAPSFDVSLVEAAFLRAAETAQNVPESKTLYHPDLGIAVDDVLKSPWFSSAYPSDATYAGDIRFVCQADADGCGKGGRTEILVYPSSEVFPDTGMALADITDYFAKNQTLKIGKVWCDATGAISSLT